MNDEPETVFSTGASRTALEDVRYDLISPWGLRRLAARYALGAKKRGDHNWRKGMPASAIINHMLEHLNLYQRGDRSDDHAAAFAWGAFALMENDELRPECNDLWTPGAEVLTQNPVSARIEPES